MYDWRISYDSKMRTSFSFITMRTRSSTWPLGRVPNWAMGCRVGACLPKPKGPAVTRRALQLRLSSVEANHIPVTGPSVVPGLRLCSFRTNAACLPRLP